MVTARVAWALHVPSLYPPFPGISQGMSVNLPDGITIKALLTWLRHLQQFDFR